MPFKRKYETKEIAAEVQKQNVARWAVANKERLKLYARDHSTSPRRSALPKEYAISNNLS